MTRNERGLSSVLTGDEPLQRCVQRVDRDRNVALLTAGPPPPDPAELLSHERLRLAIEALAEGSDLVVIDAPPVLPVADPIILAQVADATLLVATAELSDRREWAETVDRLRKVDAHVVGTVLLRPDSRVHASPSYRYAPSAAPAHWWVTEASRRTESMASSGVSCDGGAASAADGAGALLVDPTPIDQAPLDQLLVDEAPGDAYSWERSVEAETLTWKDSNSNGSNEPAGTDRAGGDDWPVAGAEGIDEAVADDVTDDEAPAG